MHTQEPVAEASEPSGSTALLTRVRRLYTIFVGLTLLVEILEWLDADTPLEPQRTVALVAIGAAAVWAVTLYRRGRTAWWLDVGIVTILSALGWGLGRNGAIIGLLIGALQLRSLYGDRRSTAIGTVGIVAAYPITTWLTDGPSGVVDLGMLTVAAAGAAIVVVLRLVAEALARHDLVATWDGALTRVAGGLLAADSLDRIDTAVAAAVAEIRDSSHRTSDGLVRTPELPRIASTADLTDLAEVPDDDVRRTLHRLFADAALARRRLEVEQRFRLLAEKSLDGIYLRTLDRPSSFRYLNPAAEELLDVTMADLNTMRDPVSAMLHPDDRSSLDVPMAADGLVSEPVQVRVVHEGSEPRWLEVEEIVVDTTVDGQTLVQGTLRDVTRQRRQEEALRSALERQRKATEELRRLDGMKSTFLQAVSHELRTPLSTVLGASATLRERLGSLDPEETQLLLDAVHRQASRLERLLGDLLDVERLSQGVVEPRRRPTALLPLVADVIAALEEGGERVRVSGDDVIAAVEGPKVERIVENLVRNALKHTPADTLVQVTVGTDDDGATITVEDNGPGIPETLRASLFEPFVQGPDAATAPSPGTGIGLALVRRLVDLHGGDVLISDTPGGGARFVVRLPDPDDGEAAAAPPSPHAVEQA